MCMVLLGLVISRNMLICVGIVLLNYFIEIDSSGIYLIIWLVNY